MNTITNLDLQVWKLLWSVSFHKSYGKKIKQNELPEANNR